MPGMIRACRGEGGIPPEGSLRENPQYASDCLCFVGRSCEGKGNARNDPGMSRRRWDYPLKAAILFIYRASSTFRTHEHPINIHDCPAVTAKCSTVAYNLELVRYRSRTILRATLLPFQRRRYIYTPDGSSALLN